MSSSPPGSSDTGRSLAQNSIYIGFVFQDILYGMELILYFKTVRVLLANGGVRKKSNLFYALFSTAMLFFVTVWVATSAIFGEEMWLLDSSFPGGPGAFFDANISVWYVDWGTTAFILLQLMTDGLLIYRCWTLWNSNRAIVVPIILWLSTLVLGVLVDWTSSLPGGNFFAGVASKLALAYYTVSVALNTLMTLMICYRVAWHGRTIQEYLGDEYASLYFSAVALVVESVLPYTLSGIAFLVSFGVNSPISQIFLPLYVMMMCISPQMLILRVVDGKAWKDDAHDQLISTMRFGPSDAAKSEQVDSSATMVHLQTLSTKADFYDEQGKMATSPV